MPSVVWHWNEASTAVVVAVELRLEVADDVADEDLVVLAELDAVLVSLRDTDVLAEELAELDAVEVLVPLTLLDAEDDAVPLTVLDWDEVTVELMLELADEVAVEDTVLDPDELADEEAVLVWVVLGVVRSQCSKFPAYLSPIAWFIRETDFSHVCAPVLSALR